MKKILAVIILLTSFTTLHAANVEVELKREGYPETTVEAALGRSQKIVDKLGLACEFQKANVLRVIANRYLELGDIHAAYDARNEQIEQMGLETKAKDEELERSYYEYNNSLYRSRFGYITYLSFYLTEKQIDFVKNEMTENMLVVRYNDFIDMLPQMTHDQRNRVYAWLVEAREFSMDFITARKQRQMFTKYRGRINNYLSKCGYDVSKAAAEQKARKEAK